jgi:hypothetical protein
MPGAPRTAVRPQAPAFRSPTLRSVFPGGRAAVLPPGGPPASVCFLYPLFRPGVVTKNKRLELL